MQRKRINTKAKQKMEANSGLKTSKQRQKHRTLADKLQTQRENGKGKSELLIDILGEVEITEDGFTLSWKDKVAE
jgi:hypothetical protein